MRYATAELCRYLNVLGHNEVTLKSDNEPTCLALKAAVKAYRTKLGLKTHIEAPEPGDHQSNPAEQAIEFLRQLTCTILAEYEKETKTAVGSLVPIHGWAWRHAGWMAHRFVKSHGITSFELVTGRPYNGKIISFGETCFGRIRSKVKGHPRWVRMLWLGKLTVSDAHVGVTPGGFLVSCRSVRRIPERFSDELCTVLRDMPYSQAAFLAGHVGQARAQRTPVGDDGPAVNAEVVPPEAPPPEQRLLPDDAMLSELVPQLPRPSIAAGTPEPPTPHQAGIASANAVNEDVAMPEPSPAGVGASPSGSSSSGSSGSNQAGRSPPETPADHVAPGSSEPAPVRKKLRLMAVTKIGDQEFYHVDGESPDEEIEADLGDGDLEIADDGQEQTLDMPQSLIFPLDHGEPELSDEELARVDQIAMEYELQRLGRMKVLAQVDGPIPGHRTLTTKFVVTWRLKSFGWIRRARLVAREYHFLDPGRTGLYSPASSSLTTRLVPALYMTHRSQGWHMLSLDVSDAYLTVSQEVDTVTSVKVGNGVVVWFKLHKCLPGQRDGSARWFRDFQDVLVSQCCVQPFPEMPSLFRMPPNESSEGAGGEFEPNPGATGGGLMHVDDLLATAHGDTLEHVVAKLSERYTIAVQWIKDIGDELTFLKRVHRLISDTELEIQVPPKHVDKLLELCNLKGAKLRPRKTPFPSGRLPTDDPGDTELPSDMASTYRSATGILLYLQSDTVACQFSVRFLAGFMQKPTYGTWKLLKHLFRTWPSMSIIVWSFPHRQSV